MQLKQNIFLIAGLCAAQMMSSFAGEPVRDSEDESSYTVWQKLLGEFILGENQYRYWSPMHVEGANGHVYIQQHSFNGTVLSRAYWGNFYTSLDFGTTSTWFYISRPTKSIKESKQLKMISFSINGGYEFKDSSWALDFNLTPSFTTEWENWKSEYFMLGARTGVRYMPSRNFVLGAGVAYLPSKLNDLLIPYFGINWQISPKWSVKTLGTEAEIIREINDNWAIGLTSAYRGGVWYIRDMGWTQRLVQDSYIVGAKIIWNPEFFEEVETKVQLLLGWSFGNKLHVYSRDGDVKQGGYSLSDSFFLQAGIFIDF